MTDAENPEDRVLEALERVAILTSDLTEHLLRIERERDEAVANLEALQSEQVGSALRNEEVAATADEIVGVDQEWLVVVVPSREVATSRPGMGSSYQQQPPTKTEKRKAKSALAAANMVSRDPGDRVYVARLVDVTVFDRPLQPELVIVKADA